MAEYSWSAFGCPRIQNIMCQYLGNKLVVKEMVNGQSW